jgi:serine/threonine protein kinase
MDIESNVTEVETIMKLNFVNYEKTFEKPRKNGHVTKWVSVKNKSEEFAFKIISEEEKSMIQNQITILKKLHDWQNIIKIYGLTCKGNKWYLVSQCLNGPNMETCVNIIQTIKIDSTLG